MKQLFTIALIALAAVTARAEIVTPAQAQAIARQFAQSSNLLKTQASGASLQLAHKAVADNGAVDFYVFNRGDNDGYVIVGGDDKALPVWGYSTTGHFDIDRMPDNMRWWLQQYQQQMQWLRSHPDAKPRKAQQLYTSVAPLLTTKWNQGRPFCLLCPIGEIDGTYYYCFTGCVATATAQIMKYYNWPITGAGHHSYDCHVNDSEEATTLSADFSQATYDWGQMIDDYNYDYTYEQGQAVARLMRDIGISVDMMYGVYGSGTYSHLVVGALTSFFGYDPSMQYIKRDDYSDDWDAMLRTELDAGRPIYYSGSGTGGHAFVFDGYDTNGYFHVNWGWGGSSDDYFSSLVLDPSNQGAGSSSGGYSNNQAAIIGIQPAQESTPSIIINGNIKPMADVMPADDVRGTIEAETVRGDYSGTLAMWVLTEDYDVLDYVETDVNITNGKQKKITFNASIDAYDGDVCYLAFRNPYISNYAYIWQSMVPFTVGQWSGPVYDQGDVDGSGSIDIDDVNAVISIILGKSSEADYTGAADVDGSSNVDIDDVNAIIATILGK